MISSYLSYNLPITITIILLHSHCLLKKPDSPKNISSNISLCFPQLLKFSIKKKKQKAFTRLHMPQGKERKNTCRGNEGCCSLGHFLLETLAAWCRERQKAARNPAHCSLLLLGWKTTKAAILIAMGRTPALASTQPRRGGMTCPFRAPSLVSCRQRLLLAGEGGDEKGGEEGGEVEEVRKGEEEWRETLFSILTLNVKSENTPKKEAGGKNMRDILARTFFFFLQIIASFHMSI